MINGDVSPSLSVWLSDSDESVRIEMQYKNLQDLAKDGKVYGIAVGDLSYKQGMAVIRFAATTHEWLEGNIGEFGKEWFVELDREFDSLRLKFKDSETETYFKLAWMQREHETE